jgi:hypothetical protein
VTYDVQLMGAPWFTPHSSNNAVLTGLASANAIIEGAIR